MSVARPDPTADPLPAAAIPAPPSLPPDPALPGLPIALDGEAVRVMLAAATADVATGGLEIVECRPRSIRYKPGANAVVLYDARLRDADGDRWLPFHLRLGRPGKAVELAARSSLRRLLARAVGRHPASPQPRAVVLPALDALVQWYPVDRRLPQLERAASSDKASSLLERAVDRVELVRYRPARSAVLRWVPVDGSADAVWVKVDVDGRSARGQRLLDALREAGVAVPDAVPVGPGLTGQRDGGGLPLTALAPAALRDAHPAVGRLLAALHRVALPGSAARLPAPYVGEADRVRAAAWMLELLAPERRRSAIRRLGEGILAAVAAAERPAAFIHGDLDPDEVLVTPSGPVLVDLDGRRGDPLVDLGGIVAQLREPDAAEALLDGYAHEASVRRRRLPVFEAAAILQLALTPFGRLVANWPEAMLELVDRAADRFSAYEDAERRHGGWSGDDGDADDVRDPADLAARGSADAGDGRAGMGPVSGAGREARPPDHGRDEPLRDPSLPTLPLLLDADVVAACLERALGHPVEISAITIVRHKPGRRATLRYDLGEGGTADRLYAKTYASERGPAVHAVLAALASAGLPDGSPAVPAPVAWLPELRAAFQHEVPGVPVAPLLLVGDREAAELLADGVAHLHESGAILARRHDPADELAPLAPAVARLSELTPHLGPAASRILAGVRRGLAAGHAWRYRPIHRDLYHDQVLVGPHGISFVDLDDASMGEPAIDVANVVAHLRLLALQDGAAGPQLEAVRDLFLARSMLLDPALDPGLVRALEAGTLLRIAPIHRPRPRGAEIASALVEAAESVLAGEATLADRSGGTGRAPHQVEASSAASTMPATSSGQPGSK